MTETIYVGADHAGFAEKERAKHLLSADYEVVDVGAEREVADDDYPLYARRVAAAVAAGSGRGLLFCGSGVGVSIAANRLPGVRAALCWSTEVAASSRDEDDSNVLCLGTRYTDISTVSDIITTWLNTPFSGEARHRRRIAEIDAG